MAPGQTAAGMSPPGPAPTPPAPVPPPGYYGGPTPGPQSGFPDPRQYQQPAGFPDPSQYQPPAASPSEPLPATPPLPPPAPWPSQQEQLPPAPAQGWSGQAQPPPSSSTRRRGGWVGSGAREVWDEGLTDAVLGVAGRALGRAISKRVRQVVEEQVVPAMAARLDTALSGRAAIAQRHPELRACLTDGVVFLAGGRRVLPLASALAVRTAEQSDALVAQLRD